MPSARPDVSIKVDEAGRIQKFRLERALEPRDIEKLAETASWLRKSTQTLRNWKKKNPAFPLELMGGHWVVIRPFLDAYLLHDWA